MRRLVLPLLAAHSAAFAALAISYFVCSRLLMPADFGAYTTALAVGAFGVLVLDGGIKISVIKRSSELSKNELGGLLLALIALAACLLAILGILFLSRRAPWVDATRGDELIASFAALHIISYPWIGISTALLERRLQYGNIARIESLCMVVERLVPLALLYLTSLGLMSFVAGLFIGRALRMVLLSRLAPISPLAREFANTRRLFAEGLWTQLGGAASSIRDNLHVLVVGPLFGTTWIGFYGWALQLSSMASQIFVQISARIALPLAAQSSDTIERWRSCVTQARILATSTAPLLAGTILTAPWLNVEFFHGRWDQSLPILALLCARMLPGVATTPLTPLLIVEQGTKSYALASIMWTAIELLSALVMARIFGSFGLAYSYAFTAWIGIYLLVGALKQSPTRRLLDLVIAVLAQPSVIVAGTAALAAIVFIGTPSLARHPVAAFGAAAAIALACLLADKRLRHALLGSAPAVDTEAPAP